MFEIDNIPEQNLLKYPTGIGNLLMVLKYPTKAVENIQHIC
jgi:hypothetical protein